MKNLFALLTVIGAGFVAAPDADARHGCHTSHTYVSHYTSCGCPVHVERYVAYYDRCGYPVYRTRTLPVNHRCRPVIQRPCGNPWPSVHRPPVIVHPQHGRYTSGGVRIGPVIVGGGGSRCR